MEVYAVYRELSPNSGEKSLTAVRFLRESLPSAELLGTGDLQSLADLANSYQVIREMRIAPFGLQDISRLAIATAAPLSPLLLTVFSSEELLIRIFKVVF